MSEKLYRVSVREVHTQDYLVKATGPEHAKSVLFDHGFEDDGDTVRIDEGSFTYSHRLSRENTTVTEEPDGEAQQQRTDENPQE